MVNKTQESTNIRISLKTKAELEATGKYGETMDYIIQRLLFISRNGKMSVEQTKKDKVLKTKL